jgi:hypothetical protein
MESNDIDELAALAGISEHTQIVRMDEQKPINDTECKHETLIQNPDDKIGDAVYHGCSNYKCGIGFYIQPQKP